MSCQKIIKKYIQKSQKTVFSKYENDSFRGNGFKSRFEVIDDYNFSEYLHRIKAQADNSFSKTYTNSRNVEDNIFSIVTSNKYQRRGDYDKELQLELSQIIRRKISYFVSNNKRISFVIPGFTTKAFNVLRVESRRLPDLAEFASLVRLYEICYQIGKVYSPGAEFVVITDGLAYAKIFDEDPYFALQHRLNLESWVKKIGIESTVKIIDLTTLLPISFSVEYKKSARALAKEWKKLEDVDEIVDFVSNSKNLVNYEREIVADMRLFYKFQHAHGEQELKRSYIEKKVIEKAIKTTFRYEAFLRTMYRLNVIDSAYDSRIRCTGRPKPEQLGINMIHERSYNFPWNGVGVLLKKGRVDVFPEYKVKYSDKFTPVFIRGDHSAFYYREN